MLISLSLVFIVGLCLGAIMKKIKAPMLLGFLLSGIILGPYILDLLDPSLLGISAELRKIALIIILTRAGLALDVEDLKKIGRPACLLSFVPASFEMAAVTIFAPLFFDMTYIEAALMGSVLAAVSPAVVVPKMLYLKENGYGREKRIPDMILAGASVDDVFVIVFFSSFLALADGGTVSASAFVKIPFSILDGIILGLAIGYVFARVFKRFHVRDSVKVVVSMSISFLLVGGEDWINLFVPVSALLAVMAAGIAVKKSRNEVAVRLSAKYGKLWVAAEIILFVLVGATVNPAYILSEGPKAVLLLVISLAFRMCGVVVSLIGTPLTRKERLFVAIAYTPKATVQAAIGSVPLAMGLGCGEVIVTVAVLSILLTAPLGAFMIDLVHKKLLTRDEDELLGDN